MAERLADDLQRSQRAYASDLTGGESTVRCCRQADVPAVLDLWAQSRSEHASTPDNLDDVEFLVADSPGCPLGGRARRRDRRRPDRRLGRLAGKHVPARRSRRTSATGDRAYAGSRRRGVPAGLRCPSDNRPCRLRRRESRSVLGVSRLSPGIARSAGEFAISRRCVSASGGSACLFAAESPSDELRLGVGVALAVVSEPAGKAALEVGVFSGEGGVCS